MSDSESGSGSDSEPEFESIIATRARRSNAGSRLRQLLDLEESNAGISVTNEDDENVNLLFAEDEDDFEFVGEEGESGEEAGDDDDSDDNEKTSKQSIRSSRTSGSTKSKTTKEDSDDKDAAANSDEMLSDSDISASDDDEEEGERELQRQEKLKRRRKRKSDLPTAALRNKKAKKDITTTRKPTVEKPSKEESVRRSHKSSLFDSAPISPAQRRHSARSATLKNSIETHEKLEEEFKRRKTIVPVAKKEYVEKTLEERLEEAKITEVENTLSLTRFYEQEIQKKKTQRDAANSRKFRLENYIRFWSTGVYVTPIEEMEEIEEEKRKIEEEEEKRIRRKLQYLKRKQARLGATADLSEEIKALAEGIESKEVEIVESENKENETLGKDDTSEKEKERVDKIESTGDSGLEQYEEGKVQSEEQKEELPSSPRKYVRFNEEVAVFEDDQEEQKCPLSVNVDEGGEAESNRNGDSINDPLISNATEGDTTQRVIYEGPSRKVTRDYVILEEFDSLLSEESIKRILLGPQSLRMGSRRDPECETICVIKQDESSNIDLQNIQSSRNESYKQLLKLPKFGEKMAINDEDDDGLTIVESEVVRINTPAPVGIHLPNGQKKICLTTGMPAMYYDPTNGVPYATVDAFKILKSLVDGEYEWLQLDNGGINSRFAGGIGCYLGKKDQRHAKGVPEGF